MSEYAQQLAVLDTADRIWGGYRRRYQTDCCSQLPLSLDLVRLLMERYSTLIIATAVMIGGNQLHRSVSVVCG